MYFSIGLLLYGILAGSILFLLVSELLNAAKNHINDNYSYNFRHEKLYEVISKVTPDIDEAMDWSMVFIIIGLLCGLLVIPLWPIVLVGGVTLFSINHLRDVNRLKKELKEKGE